LKTATNAGLTASDCGSLWPNSAYADGRGINTLTGADPVAPFGGSAFHDNKVWLRKAAG